MREILAPEQEATQQQRDSVHQQGTSGPFTVDPSGSTPSHPSPPPPSAPQPPPQYPEQQQSSQPGVQKSHQQQPSQQPGEPGGGEGSVGPGDAEAEAYGGSARTHLRPFDPQHPHPHQHPHLQQQQQRENLDGAGESADNPSQTQHPHLLQPHPPYPLLAHHPQQSSTSASPPPQPPQQLSSQYGSPPQLPVSLQPPLQLQGISSGPPLSLSLFGPTASAGPVGPQDMPYETLGLSSLHSQTHPHPHSHPHPTHQPPLSASRQQSPLLSPSPQPILQASHLSQSQLQQQPSPSQQSQSTAPSPAPQQSGQVVQQSPQQMQLQPPQLSSSPSQQLQPQLQQHVVWDELRQRDAQILVLQKKLAHFRSWLAGVHAKVQATNPSAINNYKRLYVGNLPPNTTEEELKQFLHNLMLRTGANAAPGNAILSCKLKAAPAPGAPPGAAGPVPPPGPGPPDKHYAFIELRSVEEASNAMAFDGVAFKNAYLKVRRPSNFDMATAVMLGPVAPDPTIDLSQLEICRTVVENSPHKLFVGGLPCEWGEDMVKELLVPYGTLKSFNLVMDKSTGKSKGYAFCEYVEDSSADVLIKSLHMRRIGSKALTVKRAMEGSRTGGVGLGVGSPGGGATTSGSSAGPSGPGGSGAAAATAALVAAAAQQQQQQQQLLSPQAIPPLTPANMAVMSRVAGASPGGPGGGGGSGSAAAAAAMAAALGGVGSDHSSASSLRANWGADVAEALMLFQSQSRNILAAAAAAAANPAASQTQSSVPGLAAALQQFHNRGGADLATVGSGGSSNSELAQGVRSMGQAHHGHHPGHHPHHSQHPSQHQQQQDAAVAAAAEAAAHQFAAAAGVSAFDLSTLSSGIGFW